MWLTLNEASDYARVSTRTLRRWGRQEKIVMVRPAGGKVFVQKESIDAFYLNQKEEEEALWQKIKPSFKKVLTDAK